jgi:hypothetical protein
MADISLVSLEGADEVRMTTQDHSTRPLLIRGQPGEQAFLQPGEPSCGHDQLLSLAGAGGRGFGVVQDAG